MSVSDSVLDGVASPAVEEPGPHRSEAADGHVQAEVELAIPPGYRVCHIRLRHAVAWC